MQIKLKSEDTVVNKQISGGYMSPEWVIDPSLSEPYIRQCAEAGFFTYILFVRHIKTTVRDENMRDAVAEIVKIAHRYGLKLILDTDPTHWELPMVYPDSALWRIVPVEANAFKGCARTEIKDSVGKGIIFKEIMAVYKNINGVWQRIENDSYSFEVEASCVQIFLRLTFPDAYTGALRIYTAVSVSHLLDHASKEFLDAQKAMLDMYKGIPLDGFGWDEPGKGHRFLREFRAGKGFMELFRKTNDYDLREKLIYLDRCDGSPEAAKVRCEYYGTLSDMHYNAQSEHNDYARKLWGDKLIFGTHQTWSGLPADLGAGVMDHFRLGRVLTGAWTDGGISWERKIMVFALMLADSLKKELKQRDAYYNDWALEPNVEPLRFFNRLKSLFHVNTFTHTYSDPLEGHMSVRFSSTRKIFEKDIELQDRLDALIGSRLGDTDIAIWYGWQGYAALPKWAARAVYTFFQNTSLLLTDTGLFGDFVSNEALAGAHSDNGALVINGRPYKVVVVPYAHTVPAAVYQKLIKAAENGVKVVFVGPPPAFSDKGEILDFCGTIGVEPVSHSDFETAMREKEVGINPEGWEPIFIDVICPVQPISAKAFRNIDEDIVVLKATDKDLYWLPSMDPREVLTDLITEWCSLKVEVFSRNAYFRTFSEPENPHDFVLVLAPREGMPGWGLMPECNMQNRKMRPLVKATKLRASAKIAGKELLITGGQWCALHFVNGELAEYLADDEVRICFNGRTVSE